MWASLNVSFATDKFTVGVYGKLGGVLTDYDLTLVDA